MKISTNKLKLNFFFFAVVALVLYGSYLFIEKIYSLQFLESEYFQNQALSHRERVEVLNAKRGTIYDKNFNVLASSVQSFNLALKPSEVNDLGVVKALSSVLNIS